MRGQRGFIFLFARGKFCYHIRAHESLPLGSIDRTLCKSLSDPNDHFTPEIKGRRRRPSSVNDAAFCSTHPNLSFFLSEVRHKQCIYNE